MKLTTEGIEKLQKEISAKKEELKRLVSCKGSASGDGGDGFHDNFAFEQIETQERNLRFIIAELERKLETSEVISKELKNSDKVGIGSEVKLKLRYAPNDEEELILKVTDYLKGDEVDTISISSPLGKCIYCKEKDFKGNFEVNGHTIEVEIISLSNF